MVSFAQVACSIATFVGLSLTGPVAAAEPEACPGLIASRDALFSQAALAPRRGWADVYWSRHFPA